MEKLGIVIGSLFFGINRNVLIAIFLLVFVTNAALANIGFTNPTDIKNAAKLELLKTVGGKNEIRILNNRFRIDHEVGEVVMVFFRKRGSSPIVLIRPDGSKIYIKDANGKELEWYADVDYDLIKLKSPMPGPWQAVGKISSESKIMVISDIQLQADLLPPVVFQYEKIKAKANVINANKMVVEKNFRSVVKLNASLYPSSDSTKENFGSSIYQLGEFLDNGKNLDEKPRDGIFTLEYDLNLGHGEWTPRYFLNAELFKRVLIQEPITVLPSPINFEIKLAVGNERYHFVTIMVDDSLIDNDSMLFNGAINFPNGDLQTFSIEGQQSRELKIFNSEFGTFIISLDVFGTTKDGREFSLVIPNYNFIVQATEEAPQKIQLPSMIEMPAEDKKVEKPKTDFPFILVVVVNVLILLFGFLFIWLFILKRDIPNPFSLFFKKKVKTNDDVLELPKQNKEQEKKEKPTDSDDILDLSLPDD